MKLWIDLQTSNGAESHDLIACSLTNVTGQQVTLLLTCNFMSRLTAALRLHSSADKPHKTHKRTHSELHASVSPRHCTSLWFEQKVSDVASFCFLTIFRQQTKITFKGCRVLVLQSLKCEANWGKASWTVLKSPNWNNERFHRSPIAGFQFETLNKIVSFSVKGFDLSPCRAVGRW